MSELLHKYFDTRLASAAFEDSYRFFQPPSVDTGETECNKCGLCCYKGMPYLTREEIEALSEQLRLTRNELFTSYLKVSPAHTRDTWYVLTRRHNQDGGTELTRAESWDKTSPCVFFAQDGSARCELHDTGAKPGVCASFKCWDKSTYSSPFKCGYDEFEWTVLQLEQAFGEHHDFDLLEWE